MCTYDWMEYGREAQECYTMDRYLKREEEREREGKREGEIDREKEFVSECKNRRE